MEKVEIRLLGRFAAAVDGVEIPDDRWPSLRSAQLVQLLSLAESHRLPREQVIDALWPQLDAEAGGANLRKAAHHARQAMRTPDAVQLQGGQVALLPMKSLVVDAACFERLADRALASGDASACAEAARLYGGDLLPGAPYEAWTDAARVRLRSRYLDLLRASAQWEKVAEAELTDEPAHRELMRRELASGNRPGAIRWYSRLRTALKSELGVTPDPETTALYEECISGLHPAPTAFVGRHTELSRVEAWLRAHDRCGGLLVRGEAGIGKTALCEQVAMRAREKGWNVVAVDAVQPGQAYAVLTAAVEQVLPSNPSVLEAVGAPARSVLALLTPLAAPADALKGPMGRHQVIGAVRRALMAASQGRPVMLLVNDAHLADPSDADALLQLAVTGNPVHVVLASRPLPEDSAFGRGISRLIASQRLLSIDLGPLAEEEARTLVEEAASKPPGPEAVERIVRLSGGNPFVAIELARCGAIETGVRLPGNVREAITARMCDVEEGALALLKVLALASDDFDGTTILAASPAPEAETCRMLDGALVAGALVAIEGRYRFRHDLVRRALVEQIPPHQRLKLHRETAKRLARLKAPAALVARQWLAGGSPVEATPCLLAAALDAMRLGAYADALRLVDPVLDFDRQHAQALRIRAEALDALGDPGCLAAYRAAAAVVKEPACDDLLSKAALAQVKLGDPKGALQLLAKLKPASVDGRLAMALAYSGSAALGAADPAMGTQKAAEARRLALETGDTASIVIASWAQAAAAHARGELHQSVLADLRETTQVPHLAVRVFDGQLCILQRFLYGARPYPEVIAFAKNLAAEAQRLGAARGHAFGVTLRGEAELLAGDLDSAEEHLSLGARLHRDIAAPTGEAFSLQRLAEVAMYRGDRHAASALLDQALDLARQTDIGFHLLDRIYGTRIALSDDPQGALATLEDAQEAVRGPLETCPGCRITFAVPAAIAAARAKRVDLVDAYEPGVEYLANVVMRLPAWYAALDEVRGHFALARGQGAHAAAPLFTSAAGKFRKASQPLDAARCDALARMDEA